MTPRILLLLTALFMSSTVSAQQFNVQLGKDTARFFYHTEAFGQDFGRLELEFGYLYSQDKDSLVNLGLLVRGESVSLPMIITIGARLYYANLDIYEVGALAIGGDVLLSPESWGGFGIGGFYFNAPGVVSFLDATDLVEYGAYFNFQITEQARFGLGYKHIEAAIAGAANIVIDDGGYFTLTLRF